MAVTTKEMIAVMQAFEAEKPIEWRQHDSNHWRPATTPRWNWLDKEYRVALTKPSIDWLHVSREINFLVRQSPDHGGRGLLSIARPEKASSCWINSYGFLITAEYFASYDPGTCDWQDSLVVRPGYVEDK